VADKERSHQGEVAASKWQSAVNFENIPETCGGCHEDISGAYRKSPHYEHLISSEEEVQGPSCVTCHGSINSVALNVNTVRASCERCHNRESESRPEIPDEAQVLLNRFLSIHRYYRYISIRGDPEQIRDFFKELDPQIRDLSVTWHGFDLEAIGKKTGKVLERLTDKRKQLRAQELERRRQQGPVVAPAR
jgi:hypothetical protein